ncbi:MAG TPA: Maf family protein [Acidimicrobiia bacterium]|nr:Maf family protein [Acidimicrobiia bacterium]
MRLVLASGSPRRAEVLSRLGLVFDVEAPDVDETRRPGEAPGVYVERVARDKALAVTFPDSVVVAADTAVVHEGHVLGKPAHPQEARSMLSRLQGDTHEVFTGLAVARGQEVRTLVDVTEVRMLPMTAEEISAYVDSGEPMDKAGAYALQGRGGLWVESITGSPFTVIGLPVHLLPRLVAQVAGNLDEFFAPPNLTA